jgi:CBS domain-containing protein
MPEKRIKDLMLDVLALERISPQTKVAEAVIKLLNEKQKIRRPSSLLVVDEVENREEILGMLSIDDILAHMESSIKAVEELPIFWQGQFLEECKVILDRRGSEIMSPVMHVVHQNGTLMEAVHLINSYKIDWLPVVEGKNVVGILFKEDLFKEIVAVTAHEVPGQPQERPPDLS